jgi:hypothetical protein
VCLAIELRRRHDRRMLDSVQNAMDDPAHVRVDCRIVKVERKRTQRGDGIRTDTRQRTQFCLIVGHLACETLDDRMRDLL